MQEIQVRSQGQEDSQEKKWQPALVFLPGESMDRKAWWATVYEVSKSHPQLKRLSMHTLLFLFLFSYFLFWNVMHRQWQKGKILMLLPQYPDHLHVFLVFLMLWLKEKITFCLKWLNDHVKPSLTFQIMYYLDLLHPCSSGH